jgi:hypothetical protein
MAPRSLNFLVFSRTPFWFTIEMLILDRFIRGRKTGSPSNIQGGSRMRASCTYLWLRCLSACHQSSTTQRAPYEIVREKPMKAIKIDRDVVARRMPHHAVPRRPRLFVAYIGVAHETDMVIDGSPPVCAVPDQFAAGSSRTGTPDRLQIFTTSSDHYIEAGSELAGLYLGGIRLDRQSHASPCRLVLRNNRKVADF